MSRFRKKPVVIEAIQFDGMNWRELLEWSGGIVTVHPSDNSPEAFPMVRVATLEGVMDGIPGDWIIKGVKGEFYPGKPDIFEATYEPESEATQ
jgi:hypothetical protein